MRASSRFPAALFVAACAVTAGVHFLLPRGGWSQAVTYWVVGALAAAAVVTAVVLHRPDRRAHLWALAAGLLLMTLGDVGFTYYDLAAGGTPFPSAADLVYLAAYVAYAVALLLLLRSGGHRPGLGDLLDGAIVLAGSSLIFWFALIEPLAQDSSMSLAGRIVSVGYPSLDVLLLVILVQLVSGKGGASTALRLVVVGAAALLVSDIVYASQLQTGTYAAGGLLDLGWMLSTTAWGAAALHPSVRNLHAAAPLRDTRLTLWRLGVLGVALLATPLVLALFAREATAADILLIACAGAVTTVLVFIRMSMLFREHAAAVRALRDAEARQETARALREWNERFESAAHALDGAIYEWRFESDDVYWTKGLGTAFGHDVRSAPPSNEWFFEQIHPDDRARIHEQDRQIRAGEPINENTYRFRHADGTYREVWDRWVVIQDEELGPRVVGGIIDVTERRELERRYQQSQKLEAVGRLAGGVAHDFNNLLTAISGNAELLGTSPRLDGTDRQDVAEILRAADRAAELTRQLLTFSRSKPADVGGAHLNETVAESGAMLRRLLGADVEIETKLDPAVTAVRVGAAGIEQILVNLAVNARDAMPHGGRLRLETRLQGDGRACELRVSDTGTGMDAETLSHVFEPFFTTKAPGEGTGLGLATVYGIVEQAGGTVAIDSAPGVGTTFCVTLPAAEPVEVPAQTVDSRPGAEHVLLVDDEDAVREVAARMLEQQGYDVTALADAEEAAVLLERGALQPDVVVTDLLMPRISGWALARRAHARRPGLPFLFISGHSGHASVADSAGFEAASVLGKPFTSAELTTAVRDVLADAGERVGVPA